MSSVFALQPCRLVAPEKLQDRFLTSGIISQAESYSLKDQVIIAYIFEITKPMFSSGKVLPALLETLQNEQGKLSAKGNLDTQFELLLKEVNQQLNAVSESGETDWIGSLNGLIMVLARDEVHFSQTGRCPAYLLQNNRIRQITDDPLGDFEPHPLKTFSNLASGHIKEGDQLLLANQELYHEISLDALRRILHTTSPYQANLAIAHELKKQKNPAVATLVLKVTGEGQPLSEPMEVLLEEEMQSNLMKFRKKLTPAMTAVKNISAKVGQASLETAKHTHTVMKEKVAPKAEELLHKGTESAKSYAGQLSQKMHKEKGEESIDAAVVEVIPSKNKIDPHQEIVKAAEARLEHTFGEEEEELPVAEPSAKRWQDHGTNILKKIRLLALMALGKLLIWLKVPKNRKAAGLALGVILIAATVWGALASHQSPTTGAGNNANAEALQTVTADESKITQAMSQQQADAAGKLVTSAQNLLLNLKDPSDSQKATADTLWKEIALQADQLNKATRLTTASASYTLPGNPSGFMSMLPFFYGWDKSSNALLRTGKGDANQVNASFSLGSSSDAVISVVRSTESDSVSYALTKQNKVYRILQDGNNTTYHEVTTQSGGFDVGDAIGSYGGNIYILDGKSGLLWRYTNTGAGVYNPRESVIDIGQYDIKHSISFSIDGSIYILKEDGSLLKFDRGKQDTSFALKDQPYLSRSLIKPLQVFTDENTSSIYILDGGTTTATHSTAKILEFSKTGSYLGQYTFPEDCTDVRAFDISVADKKLWILNGSQIKEFDI